VGGEGLPGRRERPGALKEGREGGREGKRRRKRKRKRKGGEGERRVPVDGVRQRASSAEGKEESHLPTGVAPLAAASGEGIEEGKEGGVLNSTEDLQTGGRRCEGG